MQVLLVGRESKQGTEVTKALQTLEEQEKDWAGGPQAQQDLHSRLLLLLLPPTWRSFSGTACACPSMAMMKPRMVEMNKGAKHSWSASSLVTVPVKGTQCTRVRLIFIRINHHMQQCSAITT